MILRQYSQIAILNVFIFYLNYKNFSKQTIMPPKRSSKKPRASTSRITEQIIPIYEILSNKQIRQPLADILPQIQNSLKQNPILLKVSFLNMLVRICGLEEYSVDIETQNTVEDLKDILEKVYQIKNTQIKPAILNIKDKFYIQFINRIRQFVQAILSDQLKISTDPKVQFNQSFMAWLQILTKSKLRPIRNSSTVFTKILVEQLIKCYQAYHQKRQSKFALNVAKTISLYLLNIICPRLIDVDSNIRDIAFDSTESILQKLQNQIMTQGLPQKIFTPLFDQDPLIVKKAIFIIDKLLQKSKDSKHLKIYIKQNIHHFIAISKSTTLVATNMQALRIIQTIQKLYSYQKIMTKGYISSLLQAFAPKYMLYAIHGTIQAFYETLYPTKQQRQANSIGVLIEIINLIAEIPTRQNIANILYAFSCNDKKVDPLKILNVDTMMSLLLAQQYKDNQGYLVKLQQRQIQNLLTLITHWIKYCSDQYKHLIKDKQKYQQILSSYNNHILLNCKELFFEKMTKYASFSQKILNLYAFIHTPTLQHINMETYLTFITQKIDKLFSQDDLPNSQCYRQIANIYFNLSKDQSLRIKFSVKSLISKLNLNNIIESSQILTQKQIYKISAVLTYCPIYELNTSQNFMDKLINTFAQNSRPERQRIQVLMVIHLVHHYNFIELFNNSSSPQVQIYRICRDKFKQFYVQILNNQEPSSIKLSGFRNLTYLLKVTSNHRFGQNPTSKLNMYQLKSDEMKVVYQYVSSQIYNTDSLDYSSLDLTRMMKGMSLEEQEIKYEIIRLLFSLYEQSYIFTCHTQSVKFIASLIKGQDQLSRQNVDRNTFLSQSGFEFSMQVKNRLNNLLQKYKRQQLKKQNLNTLIFWRLAFVMFNQIRQDSKLEIIMDKFIESYYSKKNVSSQQRPIMNTKLYIYILQAAENILQSKRYINFDVYETLIKKIHRRMDKQLIINIKNYLTQKTQGIQSPYMKSYLEMWEHLSRVHIKKPKKQTKQQGEQDGEGSNNQVDQQNQQSNSSKKVNARDTKNKQKHVRFKSTKHKNQIMEVQQDEQTIQASRAKNTRSMTKKKGR